MRLPGRHDGADGTPCRATFSGIPAMVRETRSAERVVDRKSDRKGAHRDFARTCKRGDRNRVRNACADPGKSANPRARAWRDRRAASLWCLRSREAESLGAARESAHDDRDADSEKSCDDTL